MTVVGYCDKCGGALAVWPLSTSSQLVHVSRDGKYEYRPHRPVLSDILRAIAEL